MSRLKRFIEEGGTMAEWIANRGRKAEEKATKVDVNLNLKGAEDAEAAAKKARVEEPHKPKKEDLSPERKAAAFAENVSAMNAAAKNKRRVEIDGLDEKLSSTKEFLASSGRLDPSVMVAGAKTTPNDVMKKIMDGKEKVTIGEWAVLENHMRTWHSKAATAAESVTTSAGGPSVIHQGKTAILQGAKDFFAEQKKERKAEAHLEAFLGKGEYNKTKSFFSRHAFATSAIVASTIGLGVWNGLESEKDKNDDNLSPLQRIAYNTMKLRASLPSGELLGVKYGQKFADEVLTEKTSNPATLALQSSLTTTVNENLTRGKDQAEAKIAKTEQEARYAEPMKNPLGIYRSADAPTATREAQERKTLTVTRGISGEQMKERITELKEMGIVDEDTSTKLVSAFKHATKSDVPDAEKLTKRNVAKPEEVRDFANAAMEICLKKGNTPDVAATVVNHMVLAP